MASLEAGKSSFLFFISSGDESYRNTYEIEDLVGYRVEQPHYTFFFFYEWEHRMGTMCPFSSLHP